MRKLLFFLVALISFSANAQFSDGSIYSTINSQIRLKSASQVRLAGVLDSLNKSKVNLSFKTTLDALNGILKSNGSGTYSAITDNSGNWNTAYTDRLKWDGGATGLTASTGRTSLGGTTVGSNIFTLTNPSAIRFLRINADNTVSSLSDSDFRTAIGAVSSVAWSDITGKPNVLIGTGSNELSGNTEVSGEYNMLFRKYTGDDFYVFGFSGNDILLNTAAGNINSFSEGVLFQYNSGNTAFGLNANSAFIGISPLVSSDNAGFWFDNDGSNMRVKINAFNNGALQDSTGAIYYRDADDWLKPLNPENDGDVLTLSSGVPTWAAPSGGGGITIGSTSITGGTNTRVLYNNSGVVGEYTVSGSGNVAMTTSPTFTTPNIGTATGTASGNWFNTGTTTLAGANTISGTIAANTLTFQFNDNDVSGTSRGFVLANTTSASSGNQKWHTPLTLISQGWKTNSTAASQETLWSIQNQSIQGTINPTSELNFLSQINGGSTSPMFKLTSAGVMVVGNGVAASETVLGGGYGTASITASSGNGYFNPYFKSNSGGSTTGIIISLRNSSNAKVEYGYIGSLIESNTAGSHSGSLTFRTSQSGTLSEKMIIHSSGAFSINGSYGTAGQVLTTNGSGSAASWTNKIGGSTGLTDNVILRSDGTGGLTAQGSGVTIDDLDVITATGYKQGSFSSRGTSYQTQAYTLGGYGASSTGFAGLSYMSDYSNNTVLYVEFTVILMKSDGTAAVSATVQSRFRKNNSGTWVVDAAGTAVTSDATVMTTLVGDINGGVPGITWTSGAFAGTYAGGFSSKITAYTY